ncbi:MAG: hypothetical protein LQ341_004819 [Variospora aurantia]|nr:MAG: hypothetical protein LQ341_004819 [Variospora aurantia]
MLYYLNGRETLLNRFRNLPKLFSIAHIKHWQLDLQFSKPGTTIPYCRNFADEPLVADADRMFNGELVRETVAELAKIRNLQSLKVKFPCFCKRAGSTSTTVPCTEFLEIIRRALAPLNCLRFRRSVTFIAARPLVKRADDVFGLWLHTENEQCQQSACLDFAAQFRDFKNILEGSLPRERLSLQQRRWLDIKHEVIKLLPASDLGKPLYHLWALKESNWDGFVWYPLRWDVHHRLFNQYYNNLSDQIKSAIKKERVQDTEWGVKALIP